MRGGDKQGVKTPCLWCTAVATNGNYLVARGSRQMRSNKKSRRVAVSSFQAGAPRWLKPLAHHPHVPYHNVGRGFHPRRVTRRPAPGAALHLAKRYPATTSRWVRVPVAVAQLCKRAARKPLTRRSRFRQAFRLTEKRAARRPPFQSRRLSYSKVALICPQVVVWTASSLMVKLFVSTDHS